MDIGFSKIDITPPDGTLMAGQPVNYYAKGIESRLFATAICLQQGAVSVVIVSCDLLMISNNMAVEIGEQAASKSGISADNIIICATHTHSGPITQDIFGMDADTDYANQLIPKIVSAIEIATRNCRQGGFFYGKDKIFGYAFNRRFLMSDGDVETHPLKGDPHIVCPEGPDSDNLDVFGAYDLNGTLLGAIVVFGCHATVLERNNEFISADYAGKVRDFISNKLGFDIPVLFLQGASGNICQVNPLDVSRSEVGLEWAKTMGAAIGQKTVEVLKNSKKKAKGPLRVLTREIAIPRRQVDSKLLAWAKNHKTMDCQQPILSDYGVEHFDQLKPPKYSLEQYFKTPHWANFYANEIMTLERDRQKQPLMPLTIKVVCQDDWAMVTLPCELFVEWHNEICSQSPFRHTSVVELANGWNGYIPTKIAFERKGGYETKELTSTMLIPDAGDIVLKTVLEMLNDAKKMS